MLIYNRMENKANNGVRIMADKKWTKRICSLGCYMNDRILCITYKTDRWFYN